MAGARALMRASGVDGMSIGRKPIIAVSNSFTEFVPGHTHLAPVGRIVSEAIEKAGLSVDEVHELRGWVALVCTAKEG